MDRTRYRLSVLLIVGMALVWYAWLIAPARQWVDGKAYWLLFDDPMISMRYARNLVEGNGLVWNPGGARVEGFSNPLYTLLMALAHGVCGDRALVPLLVILLGAAILVGNGFAAAGLSRHLGADDRATLVVLAVVLFQPALAFWTLRGFEVGLVSLLVVTGLWIIHGPARAGWLGPVLAALVLARADGPVMAAALLGLAAWHWWPRRTPGALVMAAMWPVAALAASTGARWLYYGELLPNTYFLKMTGGPSGPRWEKGVEVLERGLLRHHPLLLGLAGLGLAATGRSSPERRAGAWCLAVWAVGAGYSAMAGGDAWDSLHFPNRFMATVMTLPLILAAVAVVVVVRRAGSGTAAILIAGSVAFLAGFRVDFVPATGRRMAFMDMGGTLYLRWIADGAAAGGAVLCALLVPWISRRAHPVAMAAAAAVLLLSSGANVLVKRVAGRTAYIEDEVQQVTLARVLQRHSRPDARLAVSWAGTMPYHLDRIYSDTLGKCDAHIARLPHETANGFHPGHTKWDLEYTVRTDHPDAIIRPYEVRPREERFLGEAGYVLRGDCVWVLESSPLLSEEFKALESYDIEAIQRLLRTAPTFRQPDGTSTPR